jgi:hypothetical protein
MPVIPLYLATWSATDHTCMRPSATSVWGLQLLGWDVLVDFELWLAFSNSPRPLNGEWLPLSKSYSSRLKSMCVVCPWIGTDISLACACVCVCKHTCIYTPLAMPSGMNRQAQEDEKRKHTHTHTHTHTCLASSPVRGRGGLAGGLQQKEVGLPTNLFTHMPNPCALLVPLYQEELTHTEVAGETHLDFLLSRSRWGKV